MFVFIAFSRTHTGVPDAIKTKILEGVRLSETSSKRLRKQAGSSRSTIENKTQSVHADRVSDICKSSSSNSSNAQNRKRKRLSGEVQRSEGRQRPTEVDTSEVSSLLLDATSCVSSPSTSALPSKKHNEGGAHAYLTLPQSSSSSESSSSESDESSDSDDS